MQLFKIGILETGLTAPDLIEEHGSYARMFEDLLGSAAPEVEFQAYRVVENEFPNSATDCGGWVITGSRHGVYEDVDWMRRLKDFILECRDANRKLVGICFGHQILAEALGGTVVKSDRGWGVGPHTYDLDNVSGPWNNSGPAFTIHAMHQDQVVALPKGGKVFARSEFCPYAGIKYGDWAFSLQGHPEFTDSYERDLVDLRRELFNSANLADTAIHAIDEGSAPATARQ